MPALPYCVRKANPKHGKQAQNFKWLVRGFDGAVVHLAIPSHDVNRRIFVVWNPVEGMVYYTDAPLEAIDSMPDLAIGSIVWYELREGLPFFAQGHWCYYDRFMCEPGTTVSIPAVILARDTEFREVRRKGGGVIYRLIVANDGKREFSAVTDQWLKPAFLPRNLVWCIEVPPTPESRLPDGSVDRRLVKAGDLPRTTFLVDIIQRQTLYWHTRNSEWFEYTVRNPGWGFRRGQTWQRAGVVLKDGVYLWRDPITHGLYALERGGDFETFQRILALQGGKLCAVFLDNLEKVHTLFASITMRALDALEKSLPLEIEELASKLRKFVVEIQRIADEKLMISTAESDAAGSGAFEAREDEYLIKRLKLLRMRVEVTEGEIRALTVRLNGLPGERIALAPTTERKISEGKSLVADMVSCCGSVDDLVLHPRGVERFWAAFKMIHHHLMKPKRWFREETEDKAKQTKKPKSDPEETELKAALIHIAGVEDTFPRLIDAIRPSIDMFTMPELDDKGQPVLDKATKKPKIIVLQDGFGLFAFRSARDIYRWVLQAEHPILRGAVEEDQWDLRLLNPPPDYGYSPLSDPTGDASRAVLVDDWLRSEEEAEAAAVAQETALAAEEREKEIARALAEKRAVTKVAIEEAKAARKPNARADVEAWEQKNPEEKRQTEIKGKTEAEIREWDAMQREIEKNNTEREEERRQAAARSGVMKYELGPCQYPFFLQTRTPAFGRGSAPRAVPAPVMEIPVAPECDPGLPFDVSVSVWGFGKAGDKYHYLDRVQRAMTWLLKELALDRSVMDWCTTKTKRQRQREIYIDKCNRYTTWRKADDFLNAHSNGDFAQTLRLTKKTSTGGGTYMSTDGWRDPLQAMTPLGTRIYPLADAQARFFGFEVTGAVQTEDVAQQSEEKEEAREKARKDALLEYVKREKIPWMDARGDGANKNKDSAKSDRRDAAADGGGKRHAKSFGDGSSVRSGVRTARDEYQPADGAAPAWTRHPAPGSVDSREWALMIRYLMANQDVFRDKVLIDPIYSTGKFKMAVIRHDTACSVYECISDYVVMMGEIGEFDARDADQALKIESVVEFVELFRELNGARLSIRDEISSLEGDRLLDDVTRSSHIKKAEAAREEIHRQLDGALDHIFSTMVSHVKELGTRRLVREIPASVLVSTPMDRWYETHQYGGVYRANWVDVFAVADMLDQPIQIFDITAQQSLRINLAVCAPDLNPIRQDLLDGFAHPLSVVRETVGDGGGQLFHLALPEAQYVRCRLGRFFGSHRDQLDEWAESIREAKAADFHAMGDTQAEDNGSFTAAERLKRDSQKRGRDLILTDSGEVVRDFEGGVPVFRVVIKEQPPTNYSFFTTCRDAAAAHLNLPPEEIPSVYHFILDWMDYLANLPDSALHCFASASAHQLVMSGQRKADRIQAHVMETLVLPVRAAHAHATDLCVTDAQLWILCLAGLPVQACSVTPMGTADAVLSLCFYRCYEVDDRIDPREKLVLAGEGGATAVCIPLLELVSTSAVWDDGFRRGGRVAHHYHLACAADPEIRKKKRHAPAQMQHITEEGEGPRRTAGTAGMFDQHLHDFLAQGFHDPNFDDVCAEAGDEHPQWFSEDYQRHRGLGSHMGVPLEVPAALFRPGGPDPGQYQLVNTFTLHNTPGGGAMVVAGNQDANGQHVVKNAQTGYTVAVVGWKQSDNAMSRRKAYVTNVHQFPLFSYFESMRDHPLCPYPGIDHLPVSAAPAAAPSQPHLETPGFGDDGLLRVVGQDAYTYRFADVVASYGARPRLPVLRGGPSAGDRLYAHYWELSQEVKPLPPIQRRVPFPAHFNLEGFDLLELNRRARVLKTYVGTVVASLVDDEYRRVRVWRDRLARLNKRSSLSDGSCSVTFGGGSCSVEFDGSGLVRADEEPPSAVYRGVLPSSQEAFQQSVLPLFIEEAAAVVRGWVDAFAACDAKAQTGRNSQCTRVELTKFYNDGYFIRCLEAFVELERMQHIRARLGDAHLADGAPLPAPVGVVAWKSRMPVREGRGHRIPDFLSQPLRGPCNVALTPWLASCGFEKSPYYSNCITDLCSSSFETASVGNRLDHLVNRVEYRNDLVQRLARTHFIGGMKPIPLEDKDLPPVQPPLTMDALRVLANTYCSTREGETHQNGFVTRPFPSVNFVVVERIDPSSLPGCLSVVLHSDPRGLSLARSLVQLREHLPTTKEIGDDEPLPRKRELLKLCRDAHSLAHVAVILRVPDGESYRFFLLKAVHVAPHSLAMRRPDSMIVNPIAALASARVFLRAVRERGAGETDLLLLQERPRGEFIGRKNEGSGGLMEMDPTDAHRVAFTAFYKLGSEQLGAEDYPEYLHRAPQSDLPRIARERKCRIVVLKAEGGILRYLAEHDGRLCVGGASARPFKTHYVLVGKKDETWYLVPREVRTVYDTIEAYLKVQRLHIAYTKKLYDRGLLAVRVLAGLAALGRTLGVFAPLVTMSLPGPDGELVPLDVHDGADERVWLSRLEKCMAPLSGNRMITGDDNSFDVSACEKYTEQCSMFLQHLGSVLDPVCRDLGSGVDSFVASMGWLSEMGDTDFQHNPALLGIYRGFEDSVCAIHGSASFPDTTVHGLIPVDRGAAFRSLVVQRRAHRGRLDALAQTHALAALVGGAVGHPSFLRTQGLQMRLFPLGGERARFFISVVPAQNLPPAFHTHLTLHLTTRVGAYHDESKRSHFKWDPVAKTRTPFVPLLPFWDTDSNALCVLGNHEEYFRLMAAHARVKEQLRAAVAAAAGSTLHDEDGAQLREELTEREAGLMERLRAILKFHVHAYADNARGFVSTSWHIGAQEREEQACALDETIASLRESAMETAEQIARVMEDERADSAAKSEELARYQAELARIMKDPHHERRVAEDVQRRIADVVTYQERLLISVQETEMLVLAPLRVRLASIQARVFDSEDERAVLRSRTPPVFRADAELVHNHEQGRYEWRCPQNGQMYHLGTDLAREVTLSGQFEKEAVRWLRVDAHPVWDAETESFGDAETWVVPGEVPQCHCYMDYDRAGWEFRDPAQGWVRRLAPFQAHYAEVAFNTTMDGVCMHIETMHGLWHSQFHVAAKHMDRLPQNEFLLKGALCVLYVVGVQCVGGSHWRATEQETDDNGEALEENTNEHQERGEKRERDGESKKGWSSDVMDLATGKSVANNNAAGSVLRDNYDHLRLFFAYAGEPNGIAEDFGSGGHYPSWENPAIIFRESWFMRGPYTHRDTVWAIPRLPFHFGIREEALHARPLVANPTGVHSCNIERYWGYDPVGKCPSMRTKSIPFRDRSQPAFDGKFPLATKNVMDMKHLFTQRTHMFYEWIHDPHNWYWDGVDKRFCVFAFSPDMVFVERLGKTHLVQQLSVYYVDQLFPGATHADFVAEMKLFRNLRKETLPAWNAAEVAAPMPPDLNYALDGAMKQLWATAPVPGESPAVPPELCRGVEKRFDDVLRHVERSPAIKYYGFIRRHFQNPHGVPPSNPLGGDDPAPGTAKEAVRMLGQRQMSVRRLFWRLFRDKFGVPYHTFLTSPEDRARVFARVPELMGPAGRVSFKNNTGSQFLATWAAEPREADGAFADFFASYPDFRVYDQPSLAGCEFPHDPPAAPDDPNALEDWYWGNADVFPAVRAPG